MIQTELSVEMLQGSHVFPCVYLFKVIGKSDQGFAARVVAAVRQELQSAIDPPYRTRDSVGSRHQAVTLEPMVQTAEQVIAIYQRLKSVEGVLMLF